MAPRARLGLTIIFAAIAKAVPTGTNPNLCPYGYVGCYTNGVLQDNYTDQIEGDLTLEKCFDICYNQGYNYGGATGGNQCWCADSILDPNTQVEQDQCNIDCAGNPSELCGGTDAQTVYQLAPEAPQCLEGEGGGDDGGEDGGDDGGAATTPASTVVSTTGPVILTTGPSTAAAGSSNTIISSTPLYPLSNSTTIFPGTGGQSQTSTTPGASTTDTSTNTIPSTNDGAGQSEQSTTAAGTGTNGGGQGGSQGGSGTGTQASTSSPTVAPPAPTASGTTTACFEYAVVPQGGSCYSLQQQYNIDFDYLQSLNPSLDVACSNLLAGYAYCVNGIPANRVGTYSPPAMSSTSKAVVATVSTVAPGQTGARSSFMSNGSVCRYMTYTLNVGGITIGTMSA